jgi:hypothetical protein
MDADRFDSLSRSLAAPSTRRATLSLLGAGGFLTALTRRSRIAAAATESTCTLRISGVLSNSAATESTVDGTLAITVGENGAIDTGSLTTPGGNSLAVVGQATGRAISLFIDLGNGTNLALLGVGAKAITECTGTISGTIAGLEPGALGTWTATAKSPGGSSNSGSNSGSKTSGTNGSGNGGTVNGDCLSGVVCGGVCCAGATGLTPDTITCNAGICGCTYSCAAAGCDGSGSGTIVNTCGSDPSTHCHSECGSSDGNGCGDITCGDGQMLDNATCTCVDAGGGCDSPLTNCGDESFPICIDTTSDPNGCGACGVVCVSGSCVDSHCTCLADGVGPCQSTEDCCSNHCPPSGVCGCVQAGEACNNTGECCDIVGIGGCVNGVCAFVDGTACSSNVECISGKCVDGVCAQF